MSERDLARNIMDLSYRAARETRAIRRAVVDTYDADTGAAVVIYPNGAKVRRYSAGLHAPSPGEAVTMTRNGGYEEILSGSAYGGGNGASFDPP